MPIPTIKGINPKKGKTLSIKDLSITNPISIDDIIQNIENDIKNNPKTDKNIPWPVINLGFGFPHHNTCSPCFNSLFTNSLL